MYGYKRVRVSKTKTRDEHRIIMEQALGRSLNSDEVVHHKDGNRRNNDLNNLEVMTRAEHLQHHRPSYKKRTWTEFDRASYSRKFSRENHPQSKITESIAAEIKLCIASGDRNCDIARRFGLSNTIISHIRHGKRWA